MPAKKIAVPPEILTIHEALAGNRGTPAAMDGEIRVRIGPPGAGFCFSHRDHSLLREAISSSTCRQAKVVVTSPIA